MIRCLSSESKKDGYRKRILIESATTPFRLLCGLFRGLVSCAGPRHCSSVLLWCDLCDRGLCGKAVRKSGAQTIWLLQLIGGFLADSRLRRAVRARARRRLCISVTLRVCVRYGNSARRHGDQKSGHTLPFFRSMFSCGSIFNHPTGCVVVSRRAPTFAPRFVSPPSLSNPAPDTSTRRAGVRASQLASSRRAVRRCGTRE